MSKLITSDYHLHSNFSSDCESDINRIIESARNKGLTSICLTDHNDFEFPDVPSHIKFDLDIDNYINELKNLQQELQPDFDLRIGVEQGVMPSTCEKLNSFSKDHKGIDFIICSSHVVDNLDPYYAESWVNSDGSEKTQAYMYKLYFEEMLYNVNHFSDYNVYGHLDYIFRYGPKDSSTFEKVTSDNFESSFYPALKEQIYEILKTIIKSGKGIEINTGSLYRGMDFMHPHKLILKAYKELGGEILSFGSDAHDYEHIGYEMDSAAELAKSLGFKYYCTFRNMQPEYHQL